jgi:DeoR/GlpR family transcriptional regulator of sugar metabolism
MRGKHPIEMIKSDRHSRILALFDECEALSVHEVARRLGRASSVTVRRDVAELANRRLILRTHGLVSRLCAPAPSPAEVLVEDEIGDVDAIVLPPIEGRGADTLRAMARRRHVDGVTARSGPSCADERMALAARRFADAARETIVLADHSLVGTGANHRIVPIGAVSEVMTDSGSLPADRLSLSAVGARVSVVDEDHAIVPVRLGGGAQRAATTAERPGENA